MRPRSGHADTTRSAPRGALRGRRVAPRPARAAAARGAGARPPGARPRPPAPPTGPFRSPGASPRSASRACPHRCTVRWWSPARHAASFGGTHLPPTCTPCAPPSPGAAASTVALPRCPPARSPARRCTPVASVPACRLRGLPAAPAVRDDPCHGAPRGARRHGDSRRAALAQCPAGAPAAAHPSGDYAGRTRPHRRRHAARRRRAGAGARPWRRCGRAARGPRAPGTSAPGARPQGEGTTGPGAAPARDPERRAMEATRRPCAAWRASCSRPGTLLLRACASCASA